MARFATSLKRIDRCRGKPSVKLKFIYKLIKTEANGMQLYIELLNAQMQCTNVPALYRNL